MKIRRKSARAPHLIAASVALLLGAERVPAWWFGTATAFPVVEAASPSERPGAPDSAEVRRTASQVPRQVVRFEHGSSGGWTGLHAVLSVRGTGGPGGGPFLSAFTPGEGRTGYFVAPSHLLGDWTGFRSISVTMITGSGTSIHPYQHGGTGDLVISNGTMRASTVFPVKVDEVWRRQEVAFASDAGWRLEGGARNIGQVLSNVTEFRIRAEFLAGDATAGLGEVTWNPKVASGSLAGTEPSSPRQANDEVGPATTSPPMADPDGFSPGRSGFVIYRNARYGTVISYPERYFIPGAPPGNGDGRTFHSADGSASFYVFAQYDALSQTLPEMVLSDKQADMSAVITYERVGSGWYVLSGRRGASIFYRKVLADTPGGLVRVFEITYLGSRKSEFDPIVTRMAQSFGPPTTRRR
jgi:hypothetical protein